MFSYIVKLLKSLNTNSHPGEIAHAVAIGMLLGFMPKDNVLWYLLFVFFLFVRVNRGAFLLTVLVASLFARFFDPLFDSLGYAVLTFSSLKPVYAALLDIPFVAFTKFNNTIVAGSIVFSLILYIPVYIVIRIFAKSWRTYLAPALARSKFVQALYHVPFVAKIAGFFTEV
ncbi:MULTISPECIES: TIGR03546 family protein [unclassified Treponema]|uniref:TIGR03546 family protein n=1 Tax=unclassified Treponema TaxID=2638727 RepID=UPI0005301169|nr:MULTISPECIES: TIGR03546 family protein [unclassified Treponema]AIW88452.1 hypothetical protein JO41_00455 [Treponema sp. OMZ 838]UTC51534.1 TIGR03546 family protein [Treponema sp. OMZ 855]